MIAGCATTRASADRTTPASDDAAFAERMDAARVNVGLYDARSGDPIAWSDLVQRAASSDVTLIGELHGQPVGQAFQAALFRDLVRARPGAVLSMEFFERDEQAALDDYLTGLIDEEAFREQTDRTESNYPPGHRAMVEIAASQRGRVIAANAPRRYVRLARIEGMEGVESLRASQRGLFVAPDRLPAGAYAERFREMMTGMVGHTHAAEGEPDPEMRERIVEGFFFAQSVWDATMADSIADAWFEGLGPIFHIVGRFHIDRDGGLMQMLERQTPEARLLTVVMVEAEPDAFRADDLGRADVVVYLGAPPEGQSPDA
jgi:uncharacterized iron-regulated protein